MFDPCMDNVAVAIYAPSVFLQKYLDMTYRFPRNSRQWELASKTAYDRMISMGFSRQFSYETVYGC